LRAYRSAQTVQNKVLAVAGAGFGLLFMSVSAMRLVLPAFTIALACARLECPQARWRRSLPSPARPLISAGRLSSGQRFRNIWLRRQARA